MPPPKDDPVSPFATNSAWGGQPRPVFRIGPLPKAGRPPTPPPPSRPSLAYVAPQRAVAPPRPGILTGSLIPTAPVAPHPAAPPAAPAAIARVEPSPAAEPPPPPVATTAEAPVFNPIRREPPRVARRAVCRWSPGPAAWP